MISGILNVVNVVRYYSVMERLKECPTAHVQPNILSDGWCDTVLSRIAVRVWYNVRQVMHDHLSPLLILLLTILRPTNINKIAYISIATYFVFVHSLSSTAVRFCPSHSGLTSLMRSHRIRMTRDRSIPHSLQRWVSTKSSISQLMFFWFYNNVQIE